MKICALSDLHGNLPPVEYTNLDCLFICGDIVPLEIQFKYTEVFNWVIRYFIPWCKDIDVDKIFLIGGNHDCPFENNSKKLKNIFSNTNIIYLNNESVEYIKNDKTWVIFGSPDCHIFGNWAFMYDEVKEYNDFNKMPENCDILLTHDAAYNRSDMILQDVPWNKHEHTGNIELEKVLLERKRPPKYHFFGHLHTCEHNLVEYNGTQTACVSLLDENYDMVYRPLVLNI